MIWVQLKNTRPAMIIELLFCSFPLVDVSTSPSAFLHASCGSVSSRLRRLHAALKKYRVTHNAKDQ